MPTSLGPAEIMVILVVALIVLGPNRLPEAGRQVGKALAEVRRWTRDVQGEIKSVIDPDDEEAPPVAAAVADIGVPGSAVTSSEAGSTEAGPPEPARSPVSLYPPPPEPETQSPAPESIVVVVSPDPPSGASA